MHSIPKVRVFVKKRGEHRHLPLTVLSLLGGDQQHSLLLSTNRIRMMINSAHVQSLPPNKFFKHMIAPSLRYLYGGIRFQQPQPQPQPQPLLEYCVSSQSQLSLSNKITMMNNNQVQLPQPNRFLKHIVRDLLSRKPSFTVLSFQCMPDLNNGDKFYKSLISKENKRKRVLFFKNPEKRIAFDFY